MPGRVGICGTGFQPVGGRSPRPRPGPAAGPRARCPRHKLGDAGGLEALRTLLGHLPADSGLILVVVMHLAPDRVSHLPDLLQSRTGMQVVQVREMVKLEPDSVYILPPNYNISSIDSHLGLSPLEEARSQRAPIDHFFRTLAETHGPNAVALILSGSGADGSEGLKRIKVAGGLVIVQAPAEAEYDGMPQSAIDTGQADFILPLVEIAAKLVDYTQNRPKLRIPQGGEESDGDDRVALVKIFAQLRAVAGHDFSRYKRATVLRRLARRMQLRNVATLGAYLELLRGQRAEVEALFHDLLITVTNFFREPEAYEALAHQVIPRLFEDKGPADVVRAQNGRHRVYPPAVAALAPADQPGGIRPRRDGVRGGSDAGGGAGLRDEGGCRRGHGCHRTDAERPAIPEQACAQPAGGRRPVMGAGPRVHPASL
ncbi:MAG: chemotaxis protein CheB [Candidatus Promineifilaceae bacterium]